MNNIKQSFIAGFFSVITIGILTFLTYKTELGVFLIASFGSSMVLLFGYPESPFAKPKNIFFGHLLTAVVGFIFLKYWYVRTDGSAACGRNTLKHRWLKIKKNERS